MASNRKTLMPATDKRKISVSFITETGPTVIEPLETLEPGQVNNSAAPDPGLESLQRRVLRLQVTQVVLGITLMILSSVALIEDRTLFGLSFGLISAFIAVFSSIIGIHQCNLKYVSITNILALIALLPLFVFVFENLIRHSQFHISQDPNIPAFYFPARLNMTGVGRVPEDIRQHFQHTGNQYINVKRNSLPVFITNRTSENIRKERSNNTLWILCWLELAHVVPLGTTLIYLLFLYRHLNYYTHVY